MTEPQQIKSILMEAQLYQSQGLLKEAKKRYENAVALVENNDTLSNKSQLIAGIHKKIKNLDAVTYRVEKKTHIAEISPRDKDLIKRLFSTSVADDKDTSLLEGAVALAKFGQFDRAISEFEDLLEDSPLRIVAAKHILRCHMAMRMIHDPVLQFNKWVTTGFFGKEELSELSIFLERAYGFSVSAQTTPAHPQTAWAPSPGTAPVESNGSHPDSKSPEESSFDPYEDEYVDIIGSMNGASGKRDGATPAKMPDDFVDMVGAPKNKPTLRYEDIPGDATGDYIDYISSVGIPLKNGEMETLPVNLQTGSVVNLIVPVDRKMIMESLKKGVRVANVKLNSPISINTGNCTVLSVARIDMGPKKGDYSIDLKIES